MDRPRLLLTSCGGTAGTTAIRLLDDLRDRIDVVAADTHPYTYARELADDFRVLPAVDAAPVYRQAVLRLVEQCAVTALIPCHHAELVELALIGEQLAAAGVAWPSVAVEVARRLADKQAVYAALQEAGLPVPAFGELDGPRQAPAESLPRVLKPRNGMASVGLMLLPPGAPLPAAATLPGAALSRLLVQRRVTGIELSLDGVVLSSGEIRGPVGRMRLAVRHGQAVVSDSVPVPAPLRRLFHDAARALGAAGALNVQVIVDERDTPWIIDVNPRFPAGGMALSAALGLNLPRCVAMDLIYGPDSVGPVETSDAPLRHYRWYTDTVLPRERTPARPAPVSG